MSEYNRNMHLEKLHKQRREITLEKVTLAIAKMIKLNMKINFNSVANEARVSKATLYNNTLIREQIVMLRIQQNQTHTSFQIKSSICESNKEAMITILKRKIKTLEEDNTKLKEQMKINYSDIYKRL